MIDAHTFKEGVNETLKEMVALKLEERKKIIAAQLNESDNRKTALSQQSYRDRIAAARYAAAGRKDKAKEANDDSKRRAEKSIHEAVKTHKSPWHEVHVHNEDHEGRLQTSQHADLVERIDKMRKEGAKGIKMPRYNRKGQFKFMVHDDHLHEIKDHLDRHGIQHDIKNVRMSVPDKD
jgi:hypothetical protein